MIRPSVSVTRTGPGRNDIEKRLKQIAQSDVFVGIPADHTLRKGEEINNASLLFIHTHGSPLNNIPARPVLEPAIEANRALITPELAAAAKSVLDKNPNQAIVHLKRAGLVASNAAKRWFTDPRNGWPPNKPETIKRKGSSRPLIDTGQLRRAITWVVSQAGVITKPAKAEVSVVREVTAAAEEAVEDIPEAL
jgi:hypothetical protein